MRRLSFIPLLTFAAPLVLTQTTIDDSDSSLIYSVGWTHQSGVTNALDGTLSTTSLGNVTFSFSGASTLEMLCARSANPPTFNIILDGNPTNGLFADDSNTGPCLSIEQLTSGQHQLELQVLQSSGNVALFGLDGFQLTLSTNNTTTNANSTGIDNGNGTNTNQANQSNTSSTTSTSSQIVTGSTALSSPSLSPSQPSNVTDSQDSQPSSIQHGAIIFSVTVGIIVFLALSTCVGLYVWRWRRRRGRREWGNRNEGFGTIGSFDGSGIGNEKGGVVPMNKWTFGKAWGPRRKMSEAIPPKSPSFVSAGEPEARRPWDVMMPVGGGGSGSGGAKTLDPPIEEVSMIQSTSTSRSTSQSSYTKKPTPFITPPRPGPVQPLSVVKRVSQLQPQRPPPPPSTPLPPPPIAKVPPAPVGYELYLTSPATSLHASHGHGQGSGSRHGRNNSNTSGTSSGHWV